MLDPGPTKAPTMPKPIADRHEPATDFTSCRPGLPVSEAISLSFVRPHRRRRPCCHHLAGKGRDLRAGQGRPGHRQPRHAVHARGMAAGCFEGLWR